MDQSTKFDTAETAPHVREAVRDSLLLVAVLSLREGEEEHNVRIRNLSSGGLMADGVPELATGAEIWVSVRGIGKVAGKVAWKTAERIGVSFHNPVDPQRARKPVGKPKSTNYVNALRIAGVPGPRP